MGRHDKIIGLSRYGLKKLDCWINLRLLQLFRLTCLCTVLIPNRTLTWPYHNQNYLTSTLVWSSNGRANLSPQIALNDKFRHKGLWIGDGRLVITTWCSAILSIYHILYKLYGFHMKIIATWVSTKFQNTFGYQFPRLVPVNLINFQLYYSMANGRNGKWCY